MVLFTGLLTFFTAVLAGFTAKLWGATLRLARDAKATSDRQAGEMQSSLALTEKQISLAMRQVELFEKQHGLEKSQYLTTHRPKLIIRGISLHDRIEGISAEAENFPKIVFTIANVGGNRATILESNATFTKLGDPLPAIPPYSPATGTIVNQTREAGESDPRETLYIEDPDTANIVHTWFKKTAINNSGNPPHHFFFGYVRYSDSMGTVRRMAFCRRYDASAKRFIQVDDTEYEYAD